MKRWLTYTATCALLVSLLCAGVVLFPRSIAAQSSNFNLITSPLPVALTTQPGETVTKELRVKNNSSQTEQLKVTLFKFSVDDKSEVKLQEPNPNDDFIKWVSFDRATFDAPPGQWQTVNMTIKVPSTAGLGYYYAVAFSRAKADKVAPGQTALQGQVVTFVLLDVKVPNAKRELQVAKFTADKKVYEFLPSTFTMQFKNTGNIHIAPVGNIFIKRGSKMVTTLDVNSGQGNILPNSARTFSIKWTDGFPVYVTTEAGDKAKNRLEWNFNSPLSKLRFGRYTAHLVAVYNDGQHDIPLEARVSFWVIPLRLVAVVLAVLLVIIFFVYQYIRLRRKIKHLSKKETGKKA